MLWNGKRAGEAGFSNPLTRAFCISVAFHLAVGGGWWLEDKINWTRFFPALNLFARKVAAQREQLRESLRVQQERADQQMPALMFVEVDPSQAAEVPPDQAAFYGAVSTVAANAVPEKRSETPKVEGRERPETKILTDSQPAVSPRPAPPPQKAADEEEKLAKPKPATPAPEPKPATADLAMVRPADAPHRSDSAAETEPDKGQQEQTRRRPRTLAEARSAAPGQRTAMEGGVERVASNPSLAVRGTIAGEYDTRFVQAVRHRWFTLLGDRSHKPGRVVLVFHLHHDGRVSEVRVVENTVGDLMQQLYCEKAILDPAPYDRWPAEMRREIGRDVRYLTFTFTYE